MEKFNKSSKQFSVSNKKRNTLIPSFKNDFRNYISPSPKNNRRNTLFGHNDNKPEKFGTKSPLKYKRQSSKLDQSPGIS